MPNSQPTETTPDVQSSTAHPRDPLHGLTLEKILTYLVETYGWEEMGMNIRVRCFQPELDPSIKSSLKFLRKTPWARVKVEKWFIADMRKKSRENEKITARISPLL